MRWMPCVIRSVAPGGGLQVEVGHPLVDEYLEFLRARVRPNTVLAVAFESRPSGDMRQLSLTEGRYLTMADLNFLSELVDLRCWVCRSGRRQVLRLLHPGGNSRHRHHPRRK